MASMKPVLRICLLIAFAWTAAPSMRSASAADVSGLEGQWTGEQANSNQPAPVAATLIFTQGPGTLTGIMRVGAEEMPLFDVKESGTTISFTLVIPGAPYVSGHYTGARAGDEIRLVSSEEGHGVYTMTAHRDGQTQTASSQPATPRAAPPPPVQPPAPPPPPPAPIPSPLAIADNGAARLDGSWRAEQASPGSAAPIEATLIFAGNRGTMHIGADDWPLFDVKEAGANIAFALVIPGTPYVIIHYNGTLTGDGLELASLDEGQGVFKLTARRADSTQAPQVAPMTPRPAPAPARQSEPPVALLNP